jgi:Chaperone of endosialidase
MLKWLNFVWLMQNVFTLYGGGGKGGDAPDAPDYTAAAQATAQGNLEAARVAAAANRVSQYTPYGNLVYERTGQDGFDQAGWDDANRAYQQQLTAWQQSQNRPANNFSSGFGGIGGFAGISSNNQNRTPMPLAPDRNRFVIASDPDSWKATQTLSPAEQEKLDRNNDLSLGLLDTAGKGLRGVDEALSRGFNWDALPASQINAGQTAQDAIMSRLNPNFAQSEESLRTRLTNQGVRPGTQAWDNEFRNFNYGKNDAYSQAALQGIDVGNQARQQAIQEQAFGRTEGLNMVNALRTGNQVQNPNFINTPQQATTAGPDLLGAAGQQYQGQLGAYNAQQASSNGFLGGLGSLAGAGVQAGIAGGWFSDKRLKTKIRKIGTHIKGFGIYAYEKFGRYEIGVLAQEVRKIMPNAVHKHPSGYLMVRYDLLV